MDSTIEADSTKDQHNSFNDYLEASNDPLLIQYWDETSRSLNINALVNHYENGLTKLSEDTFMLIGNFYTEHNRVVITTRLEDIFKGKPESSGLIWLTNSESKSWGKTSDLNNLIDEIYKLFDKRKKTSKVVLGMVCESFQESIVLNNHFWKLSNAELMDLPARFGGEDAEFLLIPGVMVASLFHLQLNDHRSITLPVGYVSFDPKFISEVSKKLLDWTVLQPKYNDFFEKKVTKQEHTVKNKFFMPILQQSIE